MQERERIENEISLTDIFSVILAKIKLIIVVFLSGCLLGGAIGYAKSYDVVYYGTELTFFVTPKKATDEDKEVIYGTYISTIMDSLVRVLSTEKSISDYISDIEGVPEKPVYTDGMDIKEYERAVTTYKRYIQKVSNSLTFSYKEDGSKYVEANDTESKNFIYVTLSVREEGEFDKEFTRELLGQLQVKIPKIVQEAMATDQNQYAETSCTLMTPLFPMVEFMNAGYTLKETLKFAVLLGFAALVLACVVLIVMDRMDKRIKNPEELEAKFNIPLLGTIPSIKMTQDENGGEQV